MSFKNVKVDPEEYKNEYATYEDEYLKITDIKLEKYNTAYIEGGIKCTKLTLEFKKLTNERLQKIVYLYLKWLYFFINIDQLTLLIKSIAIYDFNTTYSVAKCIDSSFRDKLYQEIILNNLLEVNPPKNIKLTMKVQPEQKQYLYSNIDYFNFDTVVLMEELPLEILNNKTNEISMITNTLINMQKNMDFQFVLHNINKYNSSNIEYLYQIKRISYNEYKTLLIVKEII